MSQSALGAPSWSHVPADVEGAIAALGEEFRENEWFVYEYWPEFEPQVRVMLADIVACYPPSRRVRLLDVGCFNGYISFLLARLGYQVTGTDACDLADRRALFDKAGIGFFFSNLNELDPFAPVADASFEVVVMGQIIEHILNHPLGLMRSVARVLCPDGVLILTTPNPATVMNAVRLLSGRLSLWGTREFMEMPKFDRGQIISYGDIHYREYLASEVCHLLMTAGFRVEQMRYLGTGSGRGESLAKRWLKHNPLVNQLTRTRLFGSSHYFLARRQ
jgi:SAM-dependent methyltransferase